MHPLRKTPWPNRLIALLALLAAAFALAACNSGSTSPEAQVDTSGFVDLMADAPPALSELYDEGGTLSGSGIDDFNDTLEGVEGHPAVVNVWASWCGPCRAEFPHFREIAVEMGTEVAFFGVDTNDNDDAAETFLRDHPVPYPSIADPDQDVATEVGATFGLPATAFYNSEGKKVHVKHGGYGTKDDLREDIERYALGEGDGEGQAEGEEPRAGGERSRAEGSRPGNGSTP